MLTGQVVVFDLDGTLVDSHADIHDALRVALRETPLGQISQAADDQAVEAGCHGLPLERFFALARPGAPDEALSTFVDAYRTYYYAHLLDRTRPFPGVVDGLRRLCGQPGRQLAVATTKMTATARRVIDGLGLGRYFDLVLGSDGLPCKPDPAILLQVYRQLGHAAPDQGRAPPGAMIGDTDHDIAAGRAAGLSTCAVGWSGLPKAVLAAAGPDHHAADFEAVVEWVLTLSETGGSRRLY